MAGSMCASPLHRLPPVGAEKLPAIIGRQRSSRPRLAGRLDLTTLAKLQKLLSPTIVIQMFSGVEIW